MSMQLVKRSTRIDDLRRSGKLHPTLNPLDPSKLRGIEAELYKLKCFTSRREDIVLMEMGEPIEHGYDVSQARFHLYELPRGTKHFLHDDVLQHIVKQVRRQSGEFDWTRLTIHQLLQAPWLETNCKLHHKDTRARNMARMSAYRKASRKREQESNWQESIRPDLVYSSIDAMPFWVRHSGLHAQYFPEAYVGCIQSCDI
ncbi:hypothetical protein MPSEU_000945000 [Mayamaea pseudoterrestris]|nr:hypothetical protein MPSEU_000945000 [Mayamaea pseudoterrestris]